MADPDEPEENTETVFMPARPAAADSGPAPEPAPAVSAPAVSAPPVDAAPVTTTGRVSIGDVLNGIYEVKRLIARGGMGEVYEGVNINSDERVAIKVMLPSLAADAKVQAMFRKEARTLTRLAHPAVVQYRVLAHEPRLNVLYIVTEFVDGVELTAVLGQIHPTSSELKSLIRRLADGLRAAHELGAVHRDISPDNVLLPDRRLDRARIIDFGIAKDLDPTKATIVGDGFAGKLAYVAPEQFGDFGREIGPWTDIYSLGLVIMAVATGKDVDMGTTLVEAVDKRRQGIDLSPVAEDLRPILERMLMADPAKRARSMDEVLALLDERTTIPPATSIPPTEAFIAPPPRPLTSIPPTSLPPTSLPPATSFPTAPPTAPPTSFPAATTPPQTTVPPAGTFTLPPHETTAPPIAPPPPLAAASPKRGPPVVGLVLGALAVVVVGGAAAAYFVLQKPATKKVVAETPSTVVTAPVTAAAPTTSAGQAVAAALPGLSCSWLDVVGAVQNGQPVKLSGAAGSTATVQNAVLAAAKGAGDSLPATGVDVGAVAQADQGACSALDAFRAFKAPVGAGPALASAQPSYQITRGADGKLTGQPTITLAPRSPGQDFALMRMDTNGRLSMVYPSRKAFDAARQSDTSIVDQGGDAYTVQADALNVAGSAGLLLLTGSGPFDAALLGKPPGGRDMTWMDQVHQAGSSGGWKSSMVWYQVQNNAPQVAHPKVRTSGYYAHPGQVSEPVETPPEAPVQTQPTQKKPSAWQRLFGSSGSGSH